MKSPLSFKSVRVLNVISRLAIASFYWIATSAFASTSCVAPPNLKAGLQSKPTAKARAAIGDWFAERKQFECAAKSFELASRLEPTSISFAYLWGLSLSAAGHDAEALSPLHQASSLDQSDIRPHLLSAAALDRLKRTADSEVEWRRALAIDSDSTIALDGLSQDLVNQKDFTSVVSLLDKPSGTRALSPLQCVNLGIAFAGSARLDEAARVLREGLNTNPDSLPIADELAIVLMLLSRVEEAHAVFELALEKHHHDQPTQLLYLRTLISSHSERAPQFAKELLAEYPGQWEVLYLNGEIASEEGDFERARDLVTQSVARNPAFPESQELLGATLSKLGDLLGAKQHLEQALKAGSDRLEVHYELSKVLQRLGDPEHAQEQLLTFQRLKTARSDKTQAAGKAEVADQEMKAGNAAKAVSLYREALESDPAEPLLFYKLAKALEKTNDLIGERSALERAIELNPSLPEAQNQMGYLAAREGDSQKAEMYFHDALRASPSYVGAWVNLAATLASESKYKDAEQALGHALEIDPDNVQARQLKESISAVHPHP